LGGHGVKRAKWSLPGMETQKYASNHWQQLEIPSIANQLQ
jgi:hypothetical protein